MVGPAAPALAHLRYLLGAAAAAAPRPRGGAAAVAAAAVPRPDVAVVATLGAIGIATGTATVAAIGAEEAAADGRGRDPAPRQEEAAEDLLAAAAAAEVPEAEVEEADRGATRLPLPVRRPDDAGGAGVAVRIPGVGVGVLHRLVGMDAGAAAGVLG